MKAEKIINATIKVPIYTDRPNYNGRIVPRYALEKALRNADNIPLTIEDENGNRNCAGIITSIGFDREVDESGANEIQLHCDLYKSDFEYIVKKQHDNVIQDFEIVGFSLG